MDAPTADKAAEPIKKEFKPVILYLLTQNPKAILKTEKPTTPCRGLIAAQTDDFIIQQINKFALSGLDIISPQSFEISL